MYFCIWYSDNCQSVFFKKSSSFFIVLFSILGIMPRTVKLYDELCLCTVKICDIPSENLLTRKANGICTQKIIPKVFFFFGHILSQHFCGRNNVFIMFSLHHNPFVTLRVPPPFTQGRLLQLSDQMFLGKLNFVRLTWLVKSRGADQLQSYLLHQKYHSRYFHTSTKTLVHSGKQFLDHTKGSRIVA